MKPARQLALAALLVVGALGAYLAIRTEEAPDARVDAAAPVVAEAEPAEQGVDGRPQRSSVKAAGSRPAPPSYPSSVLPEQDLPFSQQLEGLTRLAEAGHPVAACRLLVGSVRCTTQVGNRNFARAIEGSLVGGAAAASDELLVRAIAQSDSDAQADADRCDGVDVDALASPDRYLPRAAAAMTPRQRTLLAMLRADGSVVRLPRAPDPRIRRGPSSHYLLPQFLADHSLRFLQEGVLASDPLALEGLILVHAPGFLPGSLNGMPFALPDPARFARYALLMRAIYGSSALGPAIDEMLQESLARMTPAAMSQLEAEVTAHASRWQHASAHPQLDLGITNAQEATSLCGE